MYLGDLKAKGTLVDIVGYLDDDPSLSGKQIGRTQVIGATGLAQSSVDECFVVGVGEPRLRRSLAVARHLLGGVALRVIHCTAYVSDEARIGEGAIIGPFCYVGPGAEVGDHAVLNTYASVGHDAVLGEYSVLSPYAALNGAATAEAGVFIGSGAIVAPKVRIGSGSKVSAGSVVNRNVAASSLAAGNPAAARVMFQKW